MVGALLYFVLGFAVAALLAILLAPIAVRRAVTLTRRQVEAKLPLSIDEIRAEKDKVRAELAIEVRRLEMDRDTADRARVRYEVKAHQAEELRREAFGVRDDLQAKLAKKEQEFSDTSEELSKANETIDHRDKELSDRQERIDALDAELNASSMKNEELEMENAATMMAREELQSSLNLAFNEHKELENQLRELRSTLKITQADLREAKRDKVGAEKRLARIEKRADMLEEKLLSRETTSAPAKRNTKRQDSAKANVAESSKVVNIPEKKSPPPKSAVTKAKDNASLDPKRNTLLQNIPRSNEPSNEPITSLPKAAPLKLTPLVLSDGDNQPSSELVEFETLKDELEAIGEGKAFDRLALEARLQAVAASMSASATKEKGMEDIFAAFEERAEKAPPESLARSILDAEAKL